MATGCGRPWYASAKCGGCVLQNFTSYVYESMYALCRGAAQPDLQKLRLCVACVQPMFVLSSLVVETRIVQESCRAAPILWCSPRAASCGVCLQ